MFEKKIIFQNVEVRAERIKTYIDLTYNYPNLCKEYLEKKLNKNEQNIALAIVSGEALDTISNGLYLSRRLNTKTKINKKQIINAIEEVFYSSFPQVQTMLPLFFSNDLSSSKSSYFTNKNERDIAFEHYLVLLNKKKLSINKMKKEYKEHNLSYFKYCYPKIYTDFIKIYNALDIDNLQNKPTLSDICSGLFIGILIGGCFGPLGFFHINGSTGSVKTEKQEREEERQKIFGNIGVVVSCLLWGVFIYIN